MGYNFYNTEEEILYLNNSCEYDTLSVFKFCANNLYRINERIKKGETIKIIENLGKEYAKTYNIENTADFKKWVEKIYNGGFEDYLETGMK
ncbi:hypothetical protein OD917_20045 [Flavobacterium sp. SH_e]|uniref:hypothetical protein n=1 Tax=Flavobacterium sp. SH_e TaxID=2983767 RepID=UPI0021E5132C|nr:hypothetical protein [Flavobacterium sp. SH_e]MCV2487236.1 hypothetical protein [Flavobacterium sp. SH_e]